MITSFKGMGHVEKQILSTGLLQFLGQMPKVLQTNTRTFSFKWSDPFMKWDSWPLRVMGFHVDPMRRAHPAFISRCPGSQEPPAPDPGPFSGPFTPENKQTSPRRLGRGVCDHHVQPERRKESDSEDHSWPPCDSQAHRKSPQRPPLLSVGGAALGGGGAELGCSGEAGGWFEEHCRQETVGDSVRKFRQVLFCGRKHFKRFSGKCVYGRSM